MLIVSAPEYSGVTSAGSVWVPASGSTTGDNYAPHYPWLDPPAAAAPAAPAAPAASQLHLSCAAAGHQAPASTDTGHYRQQYWIMCIFICFKTWFIII